MPIRSRGSVSKLTPKDSNATRARRLTKSRRPKRGPSRAVLTSASVTQLAAVTTRSFMAEQERAVHASEAGIEFQNVFEPGRGARFAQEVRRRAIGRDAQ